MKKLLLMFTTILCHLLGCTAQNPQFESLQTDDFEQLIADTTVVRLDVRTAEEFAEGHIANAVNIDVMQEDFSQKATELLPKDKVIAVYCRSGRRSKQAAELLAEKGFKVKELHGGFIAWTESGKKIIVVDIISAGIGDRVIITTGSSARRMLGDDTVPVDAVVVGIIDDDCQFE